MIKKAFMRASVPFILNDTEIFSGAFTQAATARGWKQFSMQGDFLLKHIDTTLSKNIICFEKRFAPLSLTVPVEDPKDKTVVHNYPFLIDCAQVFCFDTGVGICSLNIPYQTEAEEALIVNTCSALRCSAEQTNGNPSQPIVQEGNQTYLCRIFKNHLDDLLGSNYVMFGTQNDTAQRRIDMFSAALCDIRENTDEACNKWCYLLANTFDTRDGDFTVQKEHVCYQHDYIRWSFSKRGTAVVANLTGTEQNDKFLQSRWFYSIESNYFYLYIMVMHQKLAIYHILNEITADPDMNHLEINQKALIEFNAKYVFSIVSDEPFLQEAYDRLKKATSADDVYAELQEQLSHMFDYARLEAVEANEVRDRRLNFISSILGVVCSFSVIADSISLFRSYGCSFGFDSIANGIFSGVIGMEALLFVLLLLFVFILNKKKKQ